MESRVLSIQSHVVFGYVGNKASVFPLQLLGFPVDNLNSVQLSNHTGYPDGFRGHKLTADDLNSIVEGLRDNRLLRYSHVLTGFANSPEFLRGVATLLGELKKLNGELIYLCDPVMGDRGRFYVDPQLSRIYRDEILPFADIITPNLFELEQLSNSRITNECDAFKAMDSIHKLGVTVIILTSARFEDDADLELLASQKGNRFRIRFPHLEGHVTGLGDLFSALLLAWFTKHPDNLGLACETALASVQCVMRRTVEFAATKPKASTTDWELRLIQSKRDIEDPQISFRTEKIVY